MGDAIDRLTAAIDQLARDTRGKGENQAEVAELTARLAGIWQMLAELDPQVARLVLRYTE